MKKFLKKTIKSFTLLLVLFFAFGTLSCSKINIESDQKAQIINALIDVADSNLNNAKKDLNVLDKNGSYTSKDEVALYIYTYKKLPKNYITKKEAKKLGWDSTKDNLSKVAKGKSIGGDVFDNYEKLLPVIKGRKYYECDIDFNGKKRNAKRIVYADDFNEDIGYIYYTKDHYKTFERLY